MEDYELSNIEIRNLVTILPYFWKSLDECDNKLLEVKEILLRIPSGRNLQDFQHYIIGGISTLINRLTSNSSYERKLKFLIIEVLKVLFDKTKVDVVNLFFFAHKFFLGELYDPQQHNVANISEEYKLAVVQGIISLVKALTWNTVKELYTRENTLSLSPTLFVAVTMAKNEQLRSLRIASIECIMALAQIHDTVDSSDLEIRNQVADVFMFFLPGLIQGLWEIALEDEIRGHNVAVTAIRAWGRIVTLQMQNYSATDKSLPMQNLDFLNDSHSSSSFPQSKWKNTEELKVYLNSSQRTPAWYKETDSKLQPLVTAFVKLTHHSHSAVRLELMRTCLLLIEYCYATIPITTSKMIEILIILSEDEDQEISNASRVVVSMISDKFSMGVFKGLLENLEENFYASITALPRVFNSLDEKEQLSSLNLLVGYIRLFGKTHLAQVLHSTTHLKRLIQTLIQFSELEKKDISLCEEYMIQDLELVPDHRTPWKHFRYFRDSAIQMKLEDTCAVIAECNVVDITTDLLLDIFMNNVENRKEATLILNSVLAGITSSSDISDNMHIIKNVVNTYLDPEYWNLPLEVSHSCMLPEVKNNVIQICLQVEGLSKIAFAIKLQFRQFLLKTLYPILERAGSGHPLIKAAGTAAIANVSLACGYPNITELINANSDYFSYHVVRKIQRAEHNESVLNVLAMVVRYSSIDVLQSISEIIKGVLLQTCDRFFQERNANAYLRVFQMFIKCLRSWLKIEVTLEPIKSKFQRKMEHEDFRISNLNIQDDKIDTGKTAEEMYKEDMERNKQNLEEENEPPPDEYEKQEPPNHIQLAVWLLDRCLHFLPSKDRARKLLVLDILNDGLEIVRDWEDSLLPLVHHVWSPLVERFKEIDESLIVNYSFQLLVTLARLAKDFIRSRTAKDVLPHLKRTLTDLSQLSYLKDAGSAYRYTQAYKLQVTILKQLGRVVTDLDLADRDINATMEVVLPYLSDKQPIPLQEASVGFFCDIAKFDRELVQGMLQNFLERTSKDKLDYQKNIQTVLKTYIKFDEGLLESILHHSQIFNLSTRLVKVLKIFL